MTDYQGLKLEVFDQDEDFDSTFFMTVAERRPKRFYFEDGNFLLVTSSVNFRVHTDRLGQSSVINPRLARIKERGLTQSQIVRMPIPKDDPSDWASLLGLIYKDNITVPPTLHELLGIMRVSRAYGFEIFRKWSIGQLRMNFFPNPEYFHDPVDSERAEQKLNDALQIISISHCQPIETSTLILAFYAVARRDPNAIPPNMTHGVTWYAWAVVEAGRERMSRNIKRLVYTVPDVALLKKSTSVSHSNESCESALSSWVGEAGDAHQHDLLQFLRSLQTTRPSEPICPQCMAETLLVLQDEEESVYRALPVMFGFKAGKKYEADLGTYETNLESSISR